MTQTVKNNSGLGIFRTTKRSLRWNTRPSDVHLRPLVTGTVFSRPCDLLDHVFGWSPIRKCSFGGPESPPITPRPRIHPTPSRHGLCHVLCTGKVRSSRRVSGSPLLTLKHVLGPPVPKHYPSTSVLSSPRDPETRSQGRRHGLDGDLDGISVRVSYRRRHSTRFTQIITLLSVRESPWRLYDPFNGNLRLCTGTWVFLLC